MAPLARALRHDDACWRSACDSEYREPLCVLPQVRRTGDRSVSYRITARAPETKLAALGG